MPLPQIKHCLICEDVRFEMRRVYSLMGVYGATPDVTIQIEDFSLPVRLCFAFLGGAATGSVRFTAELRDRIGAPFFPSNQPFPNQVEVSFSPEFTSTAVAFWFSATFPKPDEHHILLTCNGERCYYDTFRMVQISKPWTFPIPSPTIGR
jgi:hypothetical protein